MQLMQGVVLSVSQGFLVVLYLGPLIFMLTGVVKLA